MSAVTLLTDLYVMSHSKVSQFLWKRVCFSSSCRRQGQTAATRVVALLTNVKSNLLSHSVPHSQAQLVNFSFKRYFHIFGACRHDLTMGKNKRSKRNTGTSSNNAGCHNAETQPRSRGRQGLKNLQSINKIPTKINLVVIGTGGPGSSRSLLVTTEYTRYLFNCGEGTQRLAAMSKSLRTLAFAKLAGLDHIFITHKSWENTGGLLGVAMTLEGHKNPDAKVFVKKDNLDHRQPYRDVPKMTIHGPPGVENIAMMAKKFSVSANLNIVHHEGEFQDVGLTITPLVIHKQASQMLARDEELDCGSPGLAKRPRRGSVSPPRTSSMGVAYAYLCQAQSQLPKIDMEKCIDAGVTVGPMVGRLQRGQSVVLEDGRVVYPADVTYSVPSDDRPFLIMECPSLDFLASLQECPKLQPYLKTRDRALAVIVHMTPAHVFHSMGYQSWMRGFHDSTAHMVINQDGGEVDLIRVKEHQARLNLLSQQIFPMLPELNRSAAQVGGREAEGSAAEATQAELCARQGQVVKACQGLHYVYRGKQELGFQIEVDQLHHKDLQKEFLDIPEVKREITILRQTVPETNESNLDEESLTSYPKVIFLGTGSSEPNSIRAQSCIVVQVSKHSVIILDCGEDSYGQIYRFFGPAKASSILRKVKAIFISHLHADHHLGLFSILKERKSAIDDSKETFAPALLIAPIQMRRWLKFYDTEMEPVTHLFRFVKHQQSLSEYPDGFSLDTASFEDVQRELDLTEYTPVEVQHCHNAYGVTFTHANGFKLVYSGDTRPCDSLVAAGANCDLLIHEATHEDLLQAHATVSKHSTFSEAIDVGQRMGAKNIILTHFSQRYAYMAPLYDLELPPNVGVAFDNMQVCPRTLGYLPHLIPALSTLFATELHKFQAKHTRLLWEVSDEANQQANNSS